MLALLAVVLAQTSSAPATVWPDWVHKPSAADMAQYYPPLAMTHQMAGRAVLSCGVDGHGRLVDCHAEDEAPLGYGFAEAVLKMAHLFEMKTTTIDGRPVAGGAVRIPLMFAPGGRRDGLSAALECYGTTAVRTEADPAKDTNWYATKFWALQAMAFAGVAHIQPSHVERDLEDSRRAAAERQRPQDAAECDRVMQSALKR
jgi:hypothetical protein